MNATQKALHSIAQLLTGLRFTRVAVGRIPLAGPSPSLPAFGGLLLGSLLGGLLLGVAAAQSTEIAEGGVAAAASEESVLLRWSLPQQVFVEGGFVVTRTGDGATEVFEVPSPLPRPEAVASGLVSDEEYDFLVGVFGDALGPPSSEGEEAFARAIATLTTVARPAFARVVGTLFEDDLVEPGTAYTYRVETAEGDLMGTASVTAGEIRELPPVEGVGAQVGDEQVGLRWHRPAEETLIAAYHVYREHEGSTARLTDDPYFIPLDLSEDGEELPLFNDDTVAVGETYTYRVEGIDLFGRTAPRSEPVTITIPDPTPLAAPQIANSIAGDLEITIEWSPPQDERARAVGVRRYTHPDGQNELLTPDYLPVSATSFTDEGVLGGVNYYYTLVVVDGAGRISQESNMWAERGYNPTPPSPPADVRLEERTDGLRLTWQAPPERDVASYRIYASRDGSANAGELPFADLAVDTSYLVEMLEGNLAELHLSVSAVNSSDVEGPRSTVVSGRMIDTTPPPAPRIVDVIPGQERLEVEWSLSSSPDVDTLRLYRSAPGAEPVLLRDGLEPHLGTFADESVEPGVAYGYLLEAVDASGNVSEPSARVTGRAFDLSTPEPVAGVEATLLEEGVRLEWKAKTGVSYVVERSRGGGPRFVEITDPLQSESFTDERGEAGDSYRVFAVGANGRLGAASEPVFPR